MTEYKVSREAAETEFNAFCDALDIDRDVESMNEADQKGFESNRERLVLAIMKGDLVFNDQSLPVYTCRRSDLPNPLTFHEQTGADLMAMDRKKDGQNIGKLLALMDSLTKSAPGTASKLNGVDLKVCTAIVTLFLG